MNEKSPPPSPDDLDTRLRTAQAKQSELKDGTGRVSRTSGLGFALRIGTELVAGVAVGTGIGLLLDSWLDTGPLFMILLFFLGAGAGMLNVYRTVSRIGHAVGYEKKNEDETSDTER
ncbi:MAG: AtpZ/AtpI family protein [Kiloniellales bacterium]